MIRTISRFSLIILPILYIWVIWWQSGHFDPDSVYYLSIKISPPIIVVLGITLELCHLLEFGFLYMFLILAFLGFGPLKRLWEYIALAVSLLYGVVDEIHQFYVPFRSVEVIDFIKDFVGVFVVWFIIHRVYFKRPDSKIGLLLKKITRFSSGDRNDVTL